MFLVLLPILAPVFVAVAIGCAWTKWGGPFNTDFVAKIVTNVFAPALIFETLTSSAADPEHIFAAAGAITLCVIGAAILGVGVLRIVKAPIPVYLPAIMLPNMGNMGAPLCFFAFGDEGLAYAVAVMTTGSILMWTAGAWISSGTLSPRRVLMTPPVIAAFLGIVFMLLGWRLPEWAKDSFELLAAPTFPLMLLALGASLATMQVPNIKLSIGLGAFRIAAGIACGILVTELLGIEGALRGVVILQSSMPSAVFNFLFAQMNDQRPDEVAGVVVASTVISVMVLPFLVSYVLATTH